MAGNWFRVKDNIGGHWTMHHFLHDTKPSIGSFDLQGGPLAVVQHISKIQKCCANSSESI